MNGFHKAAFGSLLVLVAAYAVIHYYGEDMLLRGLLVVAVLALLTLAFVRKLIATLLQLIALFIEGIGHVIGDAGGWMADKLDDYKRSLSRTEHTSSALDRDELDSHKSEAKAEDHGLDILETR